MLSKVEIDRLLENVKKYKIKNVINRIHIENEIASLKLDVDVFEIEKKLEEQGISISNDEVDEDGESVQIEVPFNPEKIDIVMDRIVCINFRINFVIFT